MPRMHPAIAQLQRFGHPDTMVHAWELAADIGTPLDVPDDLWAAE